MHNSSLDPQVHRSGDRIALAGLFAIAFATGAKMELPDSYLVGSVIRRVPESGL